ncbi:MAG: hypothetical protein FJ405_05685 [Verrucomicrobia bacterium]|nr:hypothetical protein [Verrucomicrobiota bacterium]
MKRILITALTGFGLSAASFAAEPFRVYAPASKTRTLWHVDAVPKGDSGLGLKLSATRPAGSPSAPPVCTCVRIAFLRPD